MTMYFITKKDSETGKKFQKIAEKLEVCFENQKALAEKYGFTSWRGEYWVAAGGISSVIFPKGTTVDTKVWKEVRNGEYMPRLNNPYKLTLTKPLQLAKKNLMPV